METSREDVSIAIRSAFLRKDAKQRFSLLALIVLAIFLIFIEKVENKPLNYFRSFLSDVIYRSSELISFPGKTISKSINYGVDHINLYKNYNNLKAENDLLKNKTYKSEFLELYLINKVHISIHLLLIVDLIKT